MSADEKELFQSLLSGMAKLEKEISTINRALSFKTTAVKKEQSVQDIKNLIITQTLLKGKGSRKSN